ncbi:MAG: glycosyl hydrolase [Pirellulales bacterium]
MHWQLITDIATVQSRVRRILVHATSACLIAACFPIAVEGDEPERAPSASPAAAVSDLEEGWDNPPLEARTRAFWWWLNGNVTRQAITRDLEAMKAKGMGGGLIFDADGSGQRSNQRVPAGPLFGSDAWRALFVHAVHEAERLGLELSLSIQSGWNLGGPGVTPSEGAKQITWSKLAIDSPGPLTQKLPQPSTRSGFYRVFEMAEIRLNGRALGVAVSARRDRRPGTGRKRAADPCRQSVTKSDHRRLATAA